MVLAKVFWLNLIKSTESGVHLRTSHHSHGNAVGSAAPKPYETQSGRGGSQGRTGMW